MHVSGYYFECKMTGNLIMNLLGENNMTNYVLLFLFIGSALSTTSCASLADAKLSGRLAFVRQSSIVVYDFATKKEHELLAGKNLRSPIWSPDGRHMLAKGGNKVIAIDSSGKEIIGIEGVPWNAITHWIDNRSFIVMIERPYNQPKVGSIRQSDLDPRPKPASPAWYYCVYQLGSDVSTLEWRVLYGASFARDPLIITKEDALLKMNKNISAELIVCTLDSKNCVVGSPYPYLLPQATRKGMRLVMAAAPRIGTNFDYSNMIQRVTTPDSEQEGLMLIPGPMLDRNSGYIPAWSPDGENVAYSFYDNDNSFAIYILPGFATKVAQAKEVIKRTSYRKSIKGTYLEGYYHPRWSPDSRYIISSHMKPQSINPLSQRIDYYINLYDTKTGEKVDLFQGEDPDWTEN